LNNTPAYLLIVNNAKTFGFLIILNLDMRLALNQF